MNRIRVLFAALIISSAFYSCDSDNPTSGNNNQGDLTITLSINRNQSWLPEAAGGGVKKNASYMQVSSAMVNP